MIANIHAYLVQHEPSTAAAIIIIFIHVNILLFAFTRILIRIKFISFQRQEKVFCLRLPDFSYLQVLLNQSFTLNKKTVVDWWSIDTKACDLDMVNISSKIENRNGTEYEEKVVWLCSVPKIHSRKIEFEASNTQ